MSYKIILSIVFMHLIHTSKYNMHMHMKVKFNFFLTYKVKRARSKPQQNWLLSLERLLYEKQRTKQTFLLFTFDFVFILIESNMIQSNRSTKFRNTHQSIYKRMKKKQHIFRINRNAGLNQQQKPVDEQ